MDTKSKLDDVLKPGLKLVFCGTAAGTRSAAIGAYYAGKGNKFWKVLAEVGLTRPQLKPEEFGLLPDSGIGLTDLVKGQAGMDKALSKDGFDVEALKAKLRANRPAVVCFNGKRAAKEFFRVDDIEYGKGPDCPDLPGITFFVAPSTSGAAGKFWCMDKWMELARLVKTAAR